MVRYYDNGYYNDGYRLWLRKVTLNFESAATDARSAHLPPSPTAILATLGDPKLSDCILTPRRFPPSRSIPASRAILAAASPYMLSIFDAHQPGATNNKQTQYNNIKPIKIKWPVNTLLVCLVHMYSGWVLGDMFPPVGAPVPQDLLVQFHCDVADIGLKDWHDILDTARMIGLLELAVDANREMRKALREE